MAQQPALTGGTRPGPLGRDRGFTLPDRGFTLVEVLVVIAIIATLIGLVAAIIPRAMLAKNKMRAQTVINSVGATLELLRNDNEQYGKYPPSRSKDLKIGKVFIGKDIGQENDVNVGIETVFFLLNCPDIHCNQVTADIALIGNTDADHYRSAKGNASDNEAREYLDPWGQPLVYINANDYKDPKSLTEVLSLEGAHIDVHPKKLPVRVGGGFLNPNSFQLFSVGPDGVQDPDEAEEGDDIIFISR